MSAKYMGMVWDLDLTPNAIYVLLALADHADHEGKNIFPRLGFIAHKTGYSIASIKRIVAALRKEKILVKDGETPGGVVKYSLDFENVPRKPEYISTSQGRPKGCPNFGPREPKIKNPSQNDTGLHDTHNRHNQLIKSNSRTSNLELKEISEKIEDFEKLADEALEEVRRW